MDFMWMWDSFHWRFKPYHNICIFQANYSHYTGDRNSIHTYRMKKTTKIKGEDDALQRDCEKMCSDMVSVPAVAIVTNAFVCRTHILLLNALHLSFNVFSLSLSITFPKQYT